MLDIPEFYSNKTIVVTGCTGFVGKVVLEKLMRSCPNFKCIYVLVRPKKGVSLLKRLDEIFKSEIFDPYFVANPAMRKGWRNVIFPLGGDLTMTELGLNKEHQEVLLKKADVVINCAASVNFDDPILDALQINYFGCLRLFEFVTKSETCDTFCHVSTAYVNSDKSGTIEEKLYELDGNVDPEDVVADIIKLTPQ